MNPIETAPVLYHFTFTIIFKQSERIYAVIKKKTSYLITNKICQASSVLPNSSFRSISLVASARRSERLNIKQMQSLGYFSAKLAQGTSSELENEAEERARGRRCRSRARNKREQRLGKEKFEIAAETSAAARNDGKQDRRAGGWEEGEGGEREREMVGWNANGDFNN